MSANASKAEEDDKAVKAAQRAEQEQAATNQELLDFVYNPHLQRKPYWNSYASLLYKVKRTQVEMMRDREYVIPDDELWFVDKEHPDYDRGLEKFVEDYRGDDKKFTIRDRMSAEYTKADGIKTIYVYYPEVEENTKKTSKNQLKEIFDLIVNTGQLNACIITEYPLSSDLKSKLTEKKLPTETFEFFLYEELAFNPTHTIWNPKFKLVTDPTIKTRISKEAMLLKTVKTEAGALRPAENLYLLPTTSEQDPIARYYGAKSGDLFHVTRTNFMFDSMVKQYNVYRFVRNTPLEVQRK